MNNGKICVSVCAKTADELIEQIKRAEELADVIEIRFDCLDEDQLQLPRGDTLFNYIKYFKHLKNLEDHVQFLITNRPIKQGGKKDLTEHERGGFFRYINYNKYGDFQDIEFDMGYLLQYQSKTQLTPIHSFHDFSGIPEDLKERFDALAENSNIIKIAIQTNDITDSIPIWQLLKRAKSENKEIIPIAMGESGKWTRILGLAHGAFMTYASLDSDKETAPGQVTANELIELYRAKELDETTDVYGIIGNNTGVSLSPLIHNTAFKFHKLNSVFVPLQVHNLDEFIKRMVKPETREIDLNFKGFAVTIPHKEAIIKHLDYLDETAEKIGAVNTVKIVDGKLYGYNTDAQGFIEPLKNVYGDLIDAKVAILGAGGSSKGCQFALEKEFADVTVFDGNAIRNPAFKKQNFSDFDLIINTTPLGMKGKFEGETPLTAKQIKDVKLIYDLVYTPFQTQFMNEADQAHVPKIGGMAMLIAQALEQQRIWTGLTAPLKEISAEVLKRLG